MAKERKSIYIYKENLSTTEKRVNAVFHQAIRYCSIQSKKHKTQEDIEACQKIMRNVKHIVAEKYVSWLEVEEIILNRVEECLNYYNNYDAEFIHKAAVKCQKEQLGKEVNYTEEEKDFVTMIKGVKGMRNFLNTVNSRLENDPDCPVEHRTTKNFENYVNSYDYFNHFNFLFKGQEETNTVDYELSL